MIQKYGTKIYVLIGGPVIREVWKENLIKCTGETYMKNIDKEIDNARARKLAINTNIQMYRCNKNVLYTRFKQ